MQGDRNYKTNWEKQGPLAIGLRKLLEELHIPGWSATQAGKHANEKDQLTTGDVKGDSTREDTIDGLWSITQSPEEEAMNPPMARIKNNLLREGTGMGTVIPVVFDKSVMLVTDADELPFEGR